MFEELKKRVMKRNVMIFVILTIIGVAFMYFITSLGTGNPLFALETFKKPQRLNDIPVDELKGKYLAEDTYTLFGNFAEYYEESESGMKTTKYQYYVMYVKDAYIGLRLPTDMDGEAWSIVEKLYPYLMEETDEVPPTLHIEGYIQNMTDEEQKYFNEWFEAEGGFFADDAAENKEQINTYTRPILFVYEKGLTTKSIIGIAVGGLIILVGIWYLVIALSGRCLKKIKKYIAANGGESTQYRIETDFKNGLRIDKTVFGKEFIIYRNGSNCNVICINDIIWVYERQVRSKNSTINYLDICTGDKKKQSITFKNIQNSLDGIHAILNMKPYIPCEKTAELSKMYNNNFQEFVNMVNRAKMDFEQHLSMNQNTGYNTENPMVDNNQPYSQDFQGNNYNQ